VNVGQALGELQLRIHDLEERRTRADKVDQGELDDAKADLLAFGLKLSAQAKEIESLHETVHKLRMAAKQSGPVRKAVTSSAEVELREENVALESQLRSMAAHGQAQQMRIARLEAASKAAIDSTELAQAQEQAADYKRHIERLEAEARGYAMQITDLKRQRDEIQAKYDEGLRASVRESRATPVQSECQVCRSIKLMVLGVEPVPRTADSYRIGSIRDRILTALRAATAPMTAVEIGEASGINAGTVQTNIYHVVKNRTVLRLGEAGGNGRQHEGYRYWLSARPLPQEVKA